MIDILSEFLSAFNDETYSVSLAVIKDTDTLSDNIVADDGVCYRILNTKDI